MKTFIKVLVGWKKISVTTGHHRVTKVHEAVELSVHTHDRSYFLLLVFTEMWILIRSLSLRNKNSPFRVRQTSLKEDKSSEFHPV